MSRPVDDFTVLCTRVLSNEASAAEHRALADLLRDPARRHDYAELVARWHALTPPPAPAFDPAPAYLRLRGKLAATASHPATPPVPAPVLAFPRTRRLAWKWLAAAAAVLALGLTWASLSHPALHSSTSWQQRTASAGERPVVVLADGTRVTLNHHSSLSYPSTFSRTRTVRLQGEAFFEVAHDARHPFIVETGDLTTTVLGTKFAINAWPENRVASVALIEGRVQVAPQFPATATEPVVLQPGRQFLRDRATGETRVTN